MKAPEKVLPLRFSVAELEGMLGWERRTVKKWLKSQGVPIDRIGRDDVVWIADLARHVPQVHRSICLQHGITERD